MKKMILLILVASCMAGCSNERAALSATATPTLSEATATPDSARLATSTLAPANQPATTAPEKDLPDGSFEFKTDFSRHTVPFSEIMAGGPPKDGIPAIDDPQYASVSEAQQWLKAREPVIVLEIGEQARAYPLQILIWHEIANDTLADIPVAVTFCPLCNTAIVFDRRAQGQILDFGTTGRLRYSNLIMYDRQTESWWQQANGRGIVGQYAGIELQLLPAAIIAWQEFAQNYPHGTVLSRNTGHEREYGNNPYVGYDQVDSNPFLYNGPDTPDKLAAVARVLTVERGGEAVAYPYDTLARVGFVNDRVGDQEIVVLWNAGTSSALDRSTIAEGRDVGAAAAYSRKLEDRVLTFERRGEQIVDSETGSVWNVLGHAVEGPLKGQELDEIVSINHFWFSWAAFKPQTRVYSDGQ